MFDVKLPPWWVGLLLLLIILIWAFYRCPEKMKVIDLVKKNNVGMYSTVVFVAIGTWCAWLLWNVPEWSIISTIFLITCGVVFFFFPPLVDDVIGTGSKINQALFITVVGVIYLSGREQTALIVIVVTMVAVLGKTLIKLKKL